MLKKLNFLNVSLNPYKVFVTYCYFYITMLISKYVFIYLFIYLFLERGREGEREGEKHQCVVASCVPHTGEHAHNPSMCPDWEWNPWPFGLQSGTQSTEPHQPGLKIAFFFKYTFQRCYIIYLTKYMKFSPQMLSTWFL